MESLRRSTDSPQLTRVSSHSHGEELKKHTHKTDSRTHPSNGSINQLLLLKKISMILVIRKLMKASGDSQPKIRVFIQLHIQNHKNPMPATVLKTQNSSIYHKRWTLETQNTFDQTSSISLMRISDKSQSTEERLHQSTSLNQENPAKESPSYQVVQALPNHLSLRYMNQKPSLKVRLKPLLVDQLQPQRKCRSYSHWSISTELTQIPQTWEQLSMHKKNEIAEKIKQEAFVLLKSSDIEKLILYLSEFWIN